MKRVLSIIIAALLVMSLAACSSSSSDVTREPADVSAASSNTNENKQAEQNEPQAEQGTKPEQDIQTSNTESGVPAIEETVLVDEAGVKITAKSLSPDELFGAEVKLLVENNSGKDLTFQCRNSSVNGYMIDTMMSVDVTDGKKANDSITFLSSDLSLCGINTIADMEFSFHIFTSDGWDTYLDTPQLQLKTSEADTYEYFFDSTGSVAYEGNDIIIVVKGLSENGSIFGPGIVVYIENNSVENITVQTRGVSVNGFMVDAIFSSDVLSCKHALDSITFMSSALEENEIDAIETVELSFHIFNSDGWDTIVDTDTITITF